MYWRMLKKDLKDKPGLNVVTFIFMIAAVGFTVIGITLLYSLILGSEKTYERCNSSDVIALMDKDLSDGEGHINETINNIKNYDIIDEVEHQDVVTIAYRCIEVVGKNPDSKSHYSRTAVLDGVSHHYDMPIDMNNEYFEVRDGCIAVSQTYANQLGIVEGDKIRITTQMGNVYEFEVSTIYKNPLANVLVIFYLSDNDKELIYSESPYKTDMFTVTVVPIEGDYAGTLIASVTPMLVEYKDYNIFGNATRILNYTNDGLFALIVAISMIVVAVAIMAVAMITIDFSLKSSIKRDEREIGMMKAIGVWSFSYKTLFIVKYIAFAIVGGVIGIPMGFVMCKVLFDKFVMHEVFPEPVTLFGIGMFAGTLTVLLIVLFSFFALRRMNKISVIDAIHGENRGERFTSIPGLFLNNKKHISVPFFLALSDILRGFKRYVLLIVAFVLGISVVLFIVRLENSLMSTNYSETYFQHGRENFTIEFDDTYYQSLYRSAGSYNGVINIVNKNLHDNGIPATIYTRYDSPAELSFGDFTSMCNISWMDSSTSEIKYIEGGNAPKLRNEIAVGYYFADLNGLKIGDTVNIEYDKLGEDMVSSEKTTESFIITAFFDRYGQQTPLIIMGDEFEGSTVQNEDIFSSVLDVPAYQYDEYFAKMQALYPDGEIEFVREDEVMEHYLTGYQRMFNLIILVVSSVAAIVLMLLTSLYENIFIDEETADIALLKSMGFNKTVIRAWHFWRLFLLSAFSLGLAYVFMATAGDYLMGRLFSSIMRCKGFSFTVQPVPNFVVLPLCIITLLVVVILLVTRLADKIEIWKVRNE